jgi:uncharacterized protein (DUF433 family)
MVAPLVNVLGSFDGRVAKVVPLKRPVPGVTVDPDVRSGYPVIEGTRVGYDQVTGLLEDDVAAEDIAEFFPAVTADKARSAQEFAEYVQLYEPGGIVERASG